MANMIFIRIQTLEAPAANAGDQERSVTKRRIVVDCRWLDYSGVGRVTELFLAGLRELAPDGNWTLWGPSRVRDFLWTGANIEVDVRPPTRWAAQRDALSIPKADAVLWLHAVRPLVTRPGVVFVHDLIPMHWATTASSRWAWGRFFGRSCRTSTLVATQSDANSSRLSKELGIIEPERVYLPLDHGRTEHVRSMRVSVTGRRPRMLYIGQVKPHKNLRRAVEAYFDSDFAKDGGMFSILAGGATRSSELEEIEALGRRNAGGKVEILPRCTDDELDQLFASATFLIQPSLEEGFALPVAEGLACGLPVCCSDIDAIREAAQGRAELFDPLSVDSIAGAIDRTAASADEGYVPDAPDMPDPIEFANRFVELIKRTAT